jgi:hypothetical protein
MRLKQLGYLFSVEPKAKMWHMEAYTLGELVRESFRKGLNIVNFYKKIGKAKEHFMSSLAFTTVAFLLIWFFFLSILFGALLYATITLSILLGLRYAIPVLRIRSKGQKLSEYKNYILLSPIFSSLHILSFSIGYLIGYIESIRKMGKSH